MAIHLLILAGIERLVYLIIALLMVILIIVGWVLIMQQKYVEGIILIGVGLFVSGIATWIRWNHPITLVNKLFKVERSGFGALSGLLGKAKK